MWGAVACTNGVLAEVQADISKLEDHPLFEGMLVCHSLTLIDGEICGDPLDAKVIINILIYISLFHLNVIAAFLRCSSATRYLATLLINILLLYTCILRVIDVRKYQMDVERFGLHAYR